MWVKWSFEWKERRGFGGREKAGRRPRQSILARAKDLEALRAERGWSRAQLARHLGVSRSAVTQALRPLDLPEVVRKVVERREAQGQPVQRRELVRVLAMEPETAARTLLR